MIFVDIGAYSINLNHVISIYWSPDREMVNFEFDVLDGDSPATLTLYKDKSIAFERWWDCHHELAGLTIVDCEESKTSEDMTVRVCQTCGELVPLGCCTCGPRQQLRALGDEKEHNE